MFESVVGYGFIHVMFYLPMVHIDKMLSPL